MKNPKKTELLHHFQHNRRAKNHDRNTDRQANHQQGHLGFRRTSLSGSSDCQHVVQAHHQIGYQNGAYGGHQVVMAGDPFLTLFFWHQQLHADPDQQHGTDNFQPRQGQQGHCKNRQHNAQNDGSAAAPQDRQPLLPLGQRSRRQRDHAALSPDNSRLTQMILSKPIQVSLKDFYLEMLFRFLNCLADWIY